MKKIAMIVAMIVMAIGAKAQDCEAIMLPYFGGDMDKLAAYRDNAPEKYTYRCVYAQAAFYESDTIPEGAELLEISTVVEWATGRRLPRNFVVDLNTLSFYAYSFGQIQVRNNSVTEQTCFSTPESRHPYLVLRSAREMREAADRYLGGIRNNNDNQ